MARPLTKYHAKRDFSRTSEPHGDGMTGERRRFVVHEHHARRLHWDLRLERDGVLLSWAIPNGIPEDPKHNRKAIHVEDHPLQYLDFKGTIPSGNYGAGQIEIWDSGDYESEKDRDGELIVVFHGKRLQGRYALFRTGEEPDWMIHRMDPPAHAREEMPKSLKPMLASIATMPSSQEDWAFELKWDGIRALAYWQPGRLRLESRNANDLTGAYPEVRPIGEQLGSHEAILDGELVALDELGRPSFERLQTRMHLSSPALIRRQVKQTPVTYVLFDLLFLDGSKLTDLAYTRRRELLEGLKLAGAAWRTPANHVGEGRQLLELTASEGLEGLIAKHRDSIYQPGMRSRDWLKIKNVLRQEFVIGGWLTGQGSRQPLGALLVGHHDPNGGPGLHYAGRVGSGFSVRQVEDLSARLKRLARKSSPFLDGPVPRDAHFVRPELVAEVQFAGWTQQGIMRHSLFKGLREDKSADEVVIERPVAPESAGWQPPPSTESAQTAKNGEILIEGRALKLTNLKKVLYPASGFTKGQLIDYYAAVAPVLLGHLADRPLTLKRYPNGVQGNHFYEKRCPAHRPQWVRTEPVWSESHDEKIDYCVVDSLPSLIWVANLASIELHTSLARAPETSRPTIVVFDLDPGEPAGLRECCRVALMIRDTLQRLDLQTVVKTSGMKGLQVYLPLNSHTSYEQTKPFAHAVSRLLENEHPELVVSRMARKLRQGKVLIDWSQNDPHKTTVCVYSTRAAEHPTVSTPLSWSQVEQALDSGTEPVLSLSPQMILSTIEERGDLFGLALALTQTLPDLAGESPAAAPTDNRRELYRRARELNIPGRSKMTAGELADAIAQATDRG
jgi:bifunctional non-homologous end joining protein LigD